MAHGSVSMPLAGGRPSRAGTGAPRSRALAVVLVALGVLVAVAALLGPLGFGVIGYHVAGDVMNQVVGGDAVALVLVAPVAVLAGVLTWRGHRAGPVLSLGPAGFAVYLYTQLAVAGEFTAEPGNSERYFVLFLAVFLLGGGAFVLAWNAVGAGGLPEPGRRLRRTAVLVLWLVAAFLTFGLHLRGVVDLTGGPPHGIDYAQAPAVFLVVKWMDLGIVVPVTAAAAVGLGRRARWATRVMYAVIGWGALLGSAVAGMGVVMVVNDDPAGSPATMVAFVVLAGALLVLNGWMLRPLFAEAREGRDPVGAVG